MPKSESEKQAKQEIRTQLETLLDSSLERKGRADIFYPQNFDVAFYLKYASKEKDKEQVRFWSYFPTYESLSEKVEPAKIFMVYMLEINVNIFIPFNILIKEAHKIGLEPKSDRTYKIHINASDINNIFIERMLSLDLKQYCNRFFLNQTDFVLSKPNFYSLDTQSIKQNTSSLFKLNYIEGNVKEILCNQYERDPQARRKCIEIHGLDCHICGFNFQKFYGDYGSNFIHVHHLVPISKIGKDYEVNPDKDLIPLCANCHAIVHRVDPPYTPEQVREVINLSIKNQRK